MKVIFLHAMLLGWGLSCPLASAQSDPPTFPLAGDWDGVKVAQGKVEHFVLHMSTTPEGKMAAIMDFVDEKSFGCPAIGGSFDGSHLVLHYTYWMPRGNRDLEPRTASYEGTVNASNSEMTGVWTREGSWPVSFKRVTWQAKIHKPAPPTIFDGDWAGIEYETRDLTIHFILHIHNTEDGLMITEDCPDEMYKGALANKVTYDQASRQLTFTSGYASWTGKMSADGKSLDTSMTEPLEHFLIHFDRLPPKTAEPN
jgi:hypothetical protein